MTALQLAMDGAQRAAQLLTLALTLQVSSSAAAPVAAEPAPQATLAPLAPVPDALAVALIVRAPWSLYRLSYPGVEPQPDDSSHQRDFEVDEEDFDPATQGADGGPVALEPWDPLAARLCDCGDLGRAHAQFLEAGEPLPTRPLRRPDPRRAVAGEPISDAALVPSLAAPNRAQPATPAAPGTHLAQQAAH